MQQQIDNHVFTGMQRDLSVSKHPANYLYDAQNIRITAKEGNTLLSITNERGPKDLSDTVADMSVTGIYLGHCVLNQYLIVFSTTSETRDIQGNTTGKDYITRFDLSVINDPDIPLKFKKKILYDSTNGSLNFCKQNLIEAISSFESENIQKIYWTDGYNQPRMINIAPYNDEEIANYKSISFDFVQELNLQEEVTVSKILGSGEFPSGVIQYAFTYFNKYGQESNIFYTTPLQYISHKDRGGSPEEKVTNAFKINISNLDSNFKYLRIYSILRTSNNGPAIVKKLEDIEIYKLKVPNPTEQTWKYTNIGILPGLTSGMPLNINNFNQVVSISIDKGNSFSPVSENLVQIYNGSNILPKTQEVIREWNTAMAAQQNKAYVCKFTKKDFPNLVLKVFDKYYTWEQSGFASEEDKTIYLAVGSTTSLILSEDTTGFCNINKYDIPPYLGISFIDYGTTGEDVDPTELLYKGGEEIIAQTLEQKDNTLFLGNIKIKREPINIQKNILELNGVTETNPIATNIQSITDKRIFYIGHQESFLQLNTLSNIENNSYKGILGFKYREYYRLGLQFQYKTGKWSEPIWIGDAQCTTQPSIENNIINIPEFKYTISQNILNKLPKGYKKVRPLIAIPNMHDRTILCQGVACPTMYRKADRWTNAQEKSQGFTFEGEWGEGDELGSLYAQASWIFRTKCPEYENEILDYTGKNGGGKISYKNRLVSQYDNQFVLSEYDGSKEDTNEQTQSILKASPYLRSTEIMGLFDDGHAFYIDPKFITIHSPEIIWDDSFYNYNFDGCFLQTVGSVLIENTYGNIDIQTSSPTVNSNASGFNHQSIKTDGYSSLITGLFYNDYIIADTKEDNVISYSEYSPESPAVSWPIYMWHKNGSLNNDVIRAGRTSELMKKKISNYKLSNYTSYIQFNNINESNNLGSSDIQFFGSDQISMIKVEGHPYQGNIESLIIPNASSPYYIVGNPNSKNAVIPKLYDESISTDSNIPGINFLSGSYYKLGDDHYQYEKTEYKTIGLWSYKYFVKDPSTSNKESFQWQTTLENIGANVKDLVQWKEGISMKYKSTPHLVASINKNILDNIDYGQLPLVEVVRPYDKNQLYGGYSDDALKANIWIPCGPSINIENVGTDVTLYYKYGDTYFQRYECLKTYAFTPEDKNQVVEIASFMCESRINMDGRYDRNKGQFNNLNAHPSTFNLMNDVYNQMDNFFTYRILDEDFYKINSYPNQVIWSKEKQPVADVDLWTNITLASTYNMDGSKGQVQSLNILQDTLYCFQDKGISNILFNARVQIPTSDGVPIEISNSYKVDGYRYLTDGVGCTNKWTIKETATGIYFIDSVTNNLFIMTGGATDIATAHNMTTWFKENKVLKTVYDDVNHDLYLLGENDALCYSEVLKEFISRMSYNGINLLESYGNNIFTMHTNKMYQFGVGDYNMYFGTFNPWFINFISNGVSNQSNNSTLDKTFTNLEYRMDRYSKNDNTNLWDNEHQQSLDYIKVYNEYQDTGTVDLKVTLDRPSNLKKKFRIWRVNIPRDKTHKRDRIRNTWCNIELGIKNNNTDKVELHDMIVQYYI